MNEIIMGERTGLRTIKFSRVWEIAKDAGVESQRAVAHLRLLGHEVKSASSRVFIEPIEREALVAHLIRTDDTLGYPDSHHLGFIVGERYLCWTREVDVILGYDRHGWVHVQDEKTGVRRRHLTHAGDRKPLGDAR